MYTSKPIRIHTKCLGILEMIEKLNNRISNVYLILQAYDTARFDHPVRLINTKQSLIDQIKQLWKVEARLVNYYQKEMAKMKLPGAVIASFDNEVNTTIIQPA